MSDGESKTSSWKFIIGLPGLERDTCLAESEAGAFQPEAMPDPGRNGMKTTSHTPDDSAFNRPSQAAQTAIPTAEYRRPIPMPPDSANTASCLDPKPPLTATRVSRKQRLGPCLYRSKQWCPQTDEKDATIAVGSSESRPFDVVHRPRVGRDIGLFVLAVVGAGLLGVWEPFQRGSGGVVEIDSEFGLITPWLMAPIRIDPALASALALPATLIVGAVSTSLALSAWYVLHRGDWRRDALIIGIVGAGTIVGLLAGLSATDVLLLVVPWCGISAMVLSTYGPIMLRQNRSLNINA